MSLLFYLAESSHHPLHLQDEARTSIPEDLHQPYSEVAHLLGVGHHPELMADPKEPISTHTDHDLCLDHVYPDNTEAPTEVAQDRTHPDLDHHQEDVEVEDETALEGMAQDGGVQAIVA